MSVEESSVACVADDGLARWVAAAGRAGLDLFRTFGHLLRQHLHLRDLGT